MHHFQLKPVRSLDNLRPAWSGHLRHNPSPSTITTNPTINPFEVFLKKPILNSSPYPLPSDTLFDQSKILACNKLTSEKTNGTVKEVDKTLLSSTSSASCNLNIESNRFLHDLNIHNDLMKPIVDLSSSCVHKKKNFKMEENFFLNDRKFNCKNSFASSNSIPNTWVSESFKTSNFLHEVNEDDPFDTSKVFMPIYVQTAPLFKSKTPLMPAQFHPLSHPLNTTSCSAHVKVNTTSSIIFLYLRIYIYLYSINLYMIV